jgi:hypothetical protein
MFYVYTYIIDGVPRYVGKGAGGRWKDHRKSTSHLGRKLQQIKRLSNEWLTPSIVSCESEEAAKTEEKRLIKLYGRKDLGTGTLYNLTEGGDGASGLIMSEKAKAILRVKNGGPNNPFFKKTHTEEVRKALSELHRGNTYTKGRKLSVSHRHNIGLSITGDNNPACKIKKADYPKLSELRMQGLTQKQIGLAVGLTQSQVSKILRSINDTTISR